MIFTDKQLRSLAELNTGRAVTVVSRSLLMGGGSCHQQKRSELHWTVYFLDWIFWILYRTTGQSELDKQGA